MPNSNAFAVRFQTLGNTVIDQMVAKMADYQLANGGRALYSFELPDNDEFGAEWRFLGANHPGTLRMNYKPSNRTPVQINDRITSWGQPALNAIQTGAGYKAFEGGPDAGNVTSLEGRGGASRCFWDEVGDAMWHCAGSTGSDDLKLNLMKYAADTDEFVHWTAGRYVAATGTVNTTYFAPTTTEFELTLVPQASIDPSWATANYYTGFDLMWDGVAQLDLRRAADRKPATAYITAQGLLHVTVASAYPIVPIAGDTCSFSDNPASLFPRYGHPHNFGTSAWDQQNRRLYKLVRPVTQGTVFYMARFNVANSAAYTTRAEWIAGRDSWMSRDAIGYDFNGTWPQTVFAPDIGTAGYGSVIVLLADSGEFFRYDCRDSSWSRYTLTTPALEVPQSSYSSTGGLLTVGATLMYHNRALYIASHCPGGDRTTAHFWRMNFVGTGTDPGDLTGPTELADCPVPMSLSGYAWPGDHTEFCRLGNYIYAFHADLFDGDTAAIAGPRVYNGGVYRYDISNDSWTAAVLPGSESWCEKLVNMGLWDPIAGSSPNNFTVTEIPRINAFLMVAGFDAAVFGAWLFKPPL